MRVQYLTYEGAGFSKSGAGRRFRNRHCRCPCGHCVEARGALTQHTGIAGRLIYPEFAVRHPSGDAPDMPHDRKGVDSYGRTVTPGAQTLHRHGGRIS